MACKIIMTLHGHKSAIKCGSKGVLPLYHIDRAGPVLKFVLGDAPIPAHENGIKAK